jgi:antitoxin VapB
MVPVAMNIKSAEAERLARRLSATTGETLTGAIVTALRERLERIERESNSGLLVVQLEDIAERAAKLPVMDSRQPDQIMGYDENGIPR